MSSPSSLSKPKTSKSSSKAFDDLLRAYVSSSEEVENGNEIGIGRKRPRRLSLPVVKASLPKKKKEQLRVLVVVPAGPNSLHRTWASSDDEECGVSVTTFVVWYGPEDQAEEGFVLKRGPKWQLVRFALKEKIKNWTEQFDFVWLPDDDLKFDSGSISKLARVCSDFELDLAQPCLVDKNITSVGYRSVVLKSSVPGAVFHRSNFVEIMCPMFSTEALQKVFSSTIDDDRCKSGWGLDSVWPILLSSVAVVDIVCVEHTRPPNAFANVAATSYANLDPRSEELELLSRFKVAPYAKRVLQVVVIADLTLSQNRT